MKYRLPDKGLNKKIICYLVVICFLTISINQNFADSKPPKYPSSLCYGFILPIVIFENKTFENQIFCRIQHLVNDLLREDVPVYWAASNIFSRYF